MEAPAAAGAVFFSPSFLDFVVENIPSVTAWPGLIGGERAA
jgi:hypothetical protein